MRGINSFAFAVVAGFLVSSSLRAEPVTFTGWETILDKDLSSTSRDLVRMRDDSSTLVPIVEDSDAVVADENDVSDGFGLFNKQDVTFTHDLSWLTPPVGFYIEAKLVITAYDVNGNNDEVIVDGIEIGTLDEGGLLFRISATVFETSDDVLLEGILGDHTLEVKIDKSSNDKITIVGSTLWVEYLPLEDGTPGGGPVPEPATIALFGPVLVGRVLLALRAWKRRRRA